LAGNTYTPTFCAAEKDGTGFAGAAGVGGCCVVAVAAGDGWAAGAAVVSDFLQPTKNRVKRQTNVINVARIEFPIMMTFLHF